MKKLLILLLCLVLTASAFAMCGCKDKIFEGRYSVATDQQIQSIVNTTHFAENGETFDYNGGLQVNYTSNIGSIDFNMSFKSVAKNFSLAMQGEACMTSSQEGSVTDRRLIYYCDDYSYTQYMVDNDVVEKEKRRSTPENLVTSYMYLGEDFFLMLSDLWDELEYETGVTWSVAESKHYNKVKVEIDTSNTVQTTVATYIYVYDASYQLVALSMDVVFTETRYNNQYIIHLTIQPWHGTITLPTDLDTYE